MAIGALDCRLAGLWRLMGRQMMIRWILIEVAYSYDEVGYTEERYKVEAFLV